MTNPAIRILIVDDSVVIRKLLTQTLAEAPGLEIVGTASLGKIALTKIPECHPDVVILDVEMPEMDGIETLRRIRKISPRLPVIMFSTKTERGAAATIEALTSGASDYVAKPSNVGNVLLAMTRVREELVPKIHALTGRMREPRVRPTPLPTAIAQPAPMPAPVAAPVPVRPKPTPAPPDAGPLTSFGAALPPPSAAVAAMLGTVPNASPFAAPRPTTFAGTAAVPVISRTQTNTATQPLRPPASPSSPPVVPTTVVIPTATTSSIPTTTTASLPKLAVLPPARPRGPTGPLVTASQFRIPRQIGPRPPIEIVAIGASTGGPNALAILLGQMPADLAVPIVVVQHMLAAFTRHFAERLASQSPLRIVEATAGDPLLPGHVYIARGDHHLLVERRQGRPVIVTNQDKLENFCRPAVDVLFRSVAQTYGASALAVVLTGMGHDGLLGAGAIREAGGDVMVQDEASSVVWGMPGFVVRAGLANHIMPLDQIGPEVRRRVMLGASRLVGNAP
jgi:two-component system chemotaxis response regulator CheB